MPVNLGTSTFDEITVTGSSTGGVNITNATGTTTYGDGTGTDLSLTTTSGATPAFGLTNAGTVSIPSGGTANVSATGGPAVDVTGITGATLAFDEVDSANSSGDGVNLAGLGTGTFTANSSSSITNATGIDFDLDGGSGAITYDGTITDDVGQLVRVANTTGGTKDFNGNITDGGNGDGSGVSLTSYTGATIRFDGGLTLATGANAAFVATLQITNNSGTLADLTMSGNTISSNGLPVNGNTTSPHGNLVNFLGGGTSVMKLTVTSGTFTGNRNPSSPPATITATAISAVTKARAIRSTCPGPHSRITTSALTSPATRSTPL